LLTVHQLASVVAADLSPEESEHDVRRARRFAYQGQVKIAMSSSPDAEFKEVSLMDLSARGMRMVYPAKLSRGTTFVARLPRIDGPELAVLCTVAHCQTRASGMFTVGVEFTCVLAEPTPADISDETQTRIRSAILSPNT
jgi:hypothetical protein